ncbi:MAG: hypothetical protein ACKO83_05365, partial [Roseiflexaceae bacterium]
DVAITSSIAQNSPEVVLIGTNGQLLAVPLYARGVNQWVGQIRDIASGEYLIRASHATTTRVRGIILEGRAELAVRDGTALLAEIASRSGGRVLSSVDESYWQPTTQHPIATRDISVWFVLGALCLFVGEIALRRGIVLPHTGRLTRMRGAAPTAPPGPPDPPIPPPPAPLSRIDRLRAAKARSRDGEDLSE